MISETDKKHVESLFPALSEIKDASIREKVIAAWVDAWKDGNYNKIEDIPWYELWRDRFTWSNVDHTNQVVSCAMAMAKVAKEIMGVEVNMDILIAGAILHDVDKAVMFDAKTKEPTDWMRKMPHGCYSLYLALKEGLPIDVAHIVITHTVFTGQLPRTPEALIVHMADYYICDIRSYFKEGIDYLFSAQEARYVDILKLHKA